VNQPGTFGDVAVLAGGKIIQDYIDELRSVKQVPGESVQHGRERRHSALTNRIRDQALSPTNVCNSLHTRRSAL
jgi:hypothetical protein